MQTILFASIAHDLRTPLNSLNASNKSLLAMLKTNMTAMGSLNA